MKIAARNLASGILFLCSLALLAAPVAAGGKSSQCSGGGKGKVTVCHRPPGNPANSHTLSISKSALKAHLGHGDVLGRCAPTCAADGADCAAAGDCCSDNCDAGVCAAACGTSGQGCESGADCCSGVCTDTSKTCADQCTIGPELHGPPCERDLDCCEGQGVCIIGLCYPENLGCSMPGAPCNPDEGQFCCFDDACLDGACVAQ